MALNTSAYSKVCIQAASTAEGSETILRQRDGQPASTTIEGAISSSARGVLTFEACNIVQGASLQVLHSSVSEQHSLTACHHLRQAQQSAHIAVYTG